MSVGLCLFGSVTDFRGGGGRQEADSGKKRKKDKRERRALAKGTKVTVFQTEEHSASFCQILKKKKKIRRTYLKREKERKVVKGR